MKICDITQFYSPVSGGVKRYLHGKIDYVLRKTDHRHVLIIPGEADGESGDERSRKVEIGSPRIPGTFSYRLLARRGRIRAALEAERPDIIEVGDSWQLAWWLSTMGHRLGIPVAGFYHSDLPRAFEDWIRGRSGEGAAGVYRRMAGPYLRRVFGRMEATLVASERLAGILGGYGIGGLRVVPLGIDTRCFRPTEDRGATRAEQGIPEGRVFLLYVGRMSGDKNTGSLPGMMALLNGEGERRYHLGLVGDGPEGERMRREAEGRRDITWFGYVRDDAEVARIYSAADLMVHPGSYETYGLTMLESQACGTPAVSVRGVGTEELNLAGEGFLAEDGSAEGLAACVRGAVQRLSEELRRRVAAEAGERFDSDACFGREMAVYEEIVAGYGRRGESGSDGRRERRD